MKTKNFDHMNCSLAQTLSVIGEHWSLLVMRDAFMGLRRFDEFQKDLGIARNILSDRLKRLVSEGILEKAKGDNSYFEYRLTEKGYEFQPILLSMIHWGDRHKPNPAGERLIFVDRENGKPIEQMAVHAKDGRGLRSRDLRATAGPGYRSRAQ